MAQICNLNTARVRNLMAEKGGSIYRFCKLNGFEYSSMSNILNRGSCTEHTLNKIAAALGVKPSEIGDASLSPKPYWWVSDSDYPVDVDFCRKCWIWNEYAKCCDYLERKGCLRPDNTIVIEKNGRHTCSVRELKSKAERRKNGVYTNSTKW